MGAVVAVILDLQLPMQSVHITMILWVRISIRERCTTSCDKVCQWLATGRWFSPGRPVSSTNKTDRHDMIEILLKVEINTIKQTILLNMLILCILLWPTLISANLFWIKLYLNYLAFLFFFTMTYLMKVISETRCVHYIIYLRFLCNISVLHWYIIRWCKWRWKPISMWWLEMNWA